MVVVVCWKIVVSSVDVCFVVVGGMFVVNSVVGVMVVGAGLVVVVVCWMVVGGAVGGLVGPGALFDGS